MQINDNMATQRTAILCQKIGRMQVRVGIKQVHLGQSLQWAVIVSNQAIQVLDLIEGDVHVTIHKNVPPRMARLSKCQKFLFAYYTDNTAGIYSTATGTQLSKIIGVPQSTNSFVISGNSHKLLYGNNNIVCLWNILKNGLQINSEQWRNINCFAIDHQGRQIVLGTYSGSILIISIITDRKVTQIEIKRHKSCVMLVAHCKDKIVSISHDRIMLTSSMVRLPGGEKGITYDQLILVNVPLFLTEIKGVPYLLQNQGIYWMQNRHTLAGFADGLYAASHQAGSLVLIRYRRGMVQWFKK